MEDENDLPDERDLIDVKLLAQRIRASAEALAGFADGYKDLDPADTSRDERQRLAEADRLVEAALNVVHHLDDVDGSGD